MRIHAIYLTIRSDGLKHIGDRSGAHNKRLAKFGAILSKFYQTIMDKMPMTTRRAWLPPIIRFDDI
jgi:hypothetical protein